MDVWREDGMGIGGDDLVASPEPPSFLTINEQASRGDGSGSIFPICKQHSNPSDDEEECIIPIQARFCLDTTTHPTQHNTTQQDPQAAKMGLTRRQGRQPQTVGGKGKGNKKAGGGGQAAKGRRGGGGGGRGRGGGGGRGTLRRRLAQDVYDYGGSVRCCVFDGPCVFGRHLPQESFPRPCPVRYG